ncbi:hypothetical protein [Salinisphaera sp. T31B1]|uniref:hypothetical protein n=1 Tax=Salinisphaera sp. T31B1 TaxID=727963 RepID=UPI00334152CD
MTRINIVAPAMSDDAALDLIRDLASMDYNVDARGPLFGEADEPVVFDTAPPNPDAMTPNDRKAHYQAEVLREQLALMRDEHAERIDESVIAETGWHIVAMRGERSE